MTEWARNLWVNEPARIVSGFVAASLWLLAELGTSAPSWLGFVVGGIVLVGGQITRSMVSPK